MVGLDTGRHASLDNNAEIALARRPYLKSGMGMRFLTQ